MKRRISIATLIFLILFSVVFPVKAATNEGYGEDQTSLGQFVDSFETSDNISTAVNVIQNATLDVMELNFTGNGGRVLENYSLYTENDANNRFAVTDNEITVESLRNSDDHHYVTYDYGVDYFSDFTHDLAARGRDNSGSAGNDRMWTWILANVIDEPIDMINNNEEIIGLYWTEFDVSDPNDPNVQLREYENGVGYLSFFEPASRDVWYYFRIVKVGTSLTCGVYSTAALRDAGNSTDGDEGNMALTLHGDWSFRYIYAVAGLNTGTPTARIISGDIANLSIREAEAGYSSSGYFTTEDYLSDPLANGSALTFLVNTSIPADTDIQFQISEDNISWTDHEGTGGASDNLTGGFQSIDLRDLNHSLNIYFRFNLSTSDPTVTPRVYQNRLITMIGNVSAPIIQNVTGAWTEYNASAINASVGTVDGGNLTSTYFIDGDTFNVSEVVGLPGMLLSVNFSGVDPDAACLWITTYYSYDGNLNHDFDIEIWNWTSSAWVDDSHLVDTVGFEWANATIYALRIPNDFLSGGEVRIQLNHETAGNINHDLFIDYIKLQAFVPSAAATEETFEFFWIVIGIALMLIGVLISKMWFDKENS